jgi:hypothetical protein
MKFTFKKQPKTTGLASVGYPHPSTDIKLDKKRVGIISAPNWSTKGGKWEIQLMRETNDDWNWAYVKQKFDSEPEAREWIKQNSEKLLTTKFHAEDECE